MLKANHVNVNKIHSQLKYLFHSEYYVLPFVGAHRSWFSMIYVFNSSQGNYQKHIIIQTKKSMIKRNATTESKWIEERNMRLGCRQLNEIINLILEMNYE